LTEAFPNVPSYWLKYSTALADKARHSGNQGDAKAAKAIGEEVVAIQRRLVNQFPDNSTYRYLLGNSLNNLGQAFNKLENAGEAVELILEGINHQLVAEQLSPRDAKISVSLAKHHANLGLSYLKLSDYQNAGLAAAQVAESMDDPEYWYLSAQILVGCLKQARADEETDEEIRAEHAQDYEEQVLSLLKECVGDNRFQGGKRRIASNATFKVFSDHPEFLNLIE